MEKVISQDPLRSSLKFFARYTCQPIGYMCAKLQGILAGTPILNLYLGVAGGSWTKTPRQKPPSQNPPGKTPPGQNPPGTKPPRTKTPHVFKIFLRLRMFFRNFLFCVIHF